MKLYRIHVSQNGIFTGYDRGGRRYLRFIAERRVLRLTADFPTRTYRIEATS